MGNKPSLDADNARGSGNLPTAGEMLNKFLTD